MDAINTFLSTFQFNSQLILKIPTSPSNIYCFLYLCSSLIIAIIFFRYKYPKQSFTDCINYLFPKQIYNHTSSKVDLLFFLLTRLIPVTPMISVLAIFSVAYFVKTLFSNIHPGSFIGLNIFSLVIFNLAYILAWDFGKFFNHYLRHRLTIVWEFHKIHHSAQQLNPLTASRIHPVDEMFANIIIGPCAGSIYGIFLWSIGEQASLLFVGGINLANFIFLSLGFHLRHTHISLRYPTWLQYILICPAQHQIHHSIEPRHFNKNYGYIFAFWDWMFNSLYIATKKEDFKVGLNTDEDQKFENIFNIYFLPFFNIADRFSFIVKKLTKKIN